MLLKILLVILTKAILIIIARDAPLISKFKPDFCNRTSEFCGYGETHVACNKNNWYIRCLSDKSELYEITEDLEGSIVGKLNQLRADTAKGSSHLPQAGRMGSVVYDNTLGHVAALLCNSCEFNYDLCFATPSYPSAGRLTYVATYLEEAYTIDNIVDVILLAIDKWYETKKHVSGQYVINYQRSSWRSYPFLTLVLEDNTKVGCAVLYYKRTIWHRYFVNCLFATKCRNFKPVYSAAYKGLGKDCEIISTLQDKTLCNDTIKYKYRYIDNYYS